MTTTETTPVQSTIDTYFAAWNEPDRDARVDLLTEVFADQAHYVDPLADVSGPAAIADMIEGVRAQFAGATLQRATDIDAHHHVLRFGWSATGTDGAVIVAGIDVAVLGEDGRITALAGFFG
jgi:hypothetical protein